MLIWDAHSCLPLSPNTSIGLLSKHKKSGIDVVSINVGMDFNPLSQIMAVIASFRKQISESDSLLQISDLESVYTAKKKRQISRFI